jgi:MraZ protein
MAIFTGKHLHTIDEKNRLAIPSSIRKCVDEEKEGKGFYITPGMDKCLALYSPLHFEETSKKLTEPMFTNKKARNFQRLFFSMSSGPIACDKQGRIIIPQQHKDHAGLKRDVIIVGVMDKIEIWDLQCWNEFEADNSQNFEQDAEDLFRLGSAPSP